MQPIMERYPGLTDFGQAAYSTIRNAASEIPPRPASMGEIFAVLQGRKPINHKEAVRKVVPIVCKLKHKLPPDEIECVRGVGYYSRSATSLE